MVILNDSATKLRGGYYTPKPVAKFLTKWAINDNVSTVLEPSAGDGQFVEAINARLGDRATITAVELDPDEAKKAGCKGGQSTTVITGDFFTWYEQHGLDGSFDVVVGNPPFIRYQQFDDKYRKPAFNLMEQEGLRPSSSQMRGCHS